MSPTSDCQYNGTVMGEITAHVASHSFLLLYSDNTELLVWAAAL